MISLLIPTRNSSYFVMRLLTYYQELGFQGRICIGDSSDGHHLTRTKKVAEKLQGQLDIVRREYPGWSEVECINGLMDSVETKYAVVMPDSDFLVPNGLERCVEFLEAQPEFVAAHGIAVRLDLFSNGAYGDVRSVVQCRQGPLEDETATGRLLSHLRSYTVPRFSVQKASHISSIFKRVLHMSDGLFGLELLPSCLTATQGKVKDLDCFYLAHQAKGRQKPSPAAFDWITSPDWSTSYRLFRDCVAEGLAFQDGVEMDAAREVVKEAFWGYLIRGLENQPQQTKRRQGMNLKSLPREWGARFPGIRRAYHSWRSSRPTEEYKTRMTALLGGTSPYHRDFMPIYRSINSPVNVVDNESS